MVNKNYRIKNLKFISIIACLFLFGFYGNSIAGDWLQKESKHFKIVYRPNHAHLVDHILVSAEKSLYRLSKIFDYQPKDKIVINTNDYADYGYGRATSVPENFISIVIEPFENLYENFPYTERIQWLLNHELVHIIVNDQASKAEAFSRSIFSKVPPERKHPFSTFFSLLTNFSRYTPRWQQEGIAVFMETWLSGGFGRILGNFDEMYFRSLTLEGEEIPDIVELDAIQTHNSFLLANLFYLYGSRFVAYLALEYGPDKLISWYKVDENDFYKDFEDKFEEVFNITFEKAWKNFASFEKSFQEKNIAKLRKFPVTPVKKITADNFGWITKPFYDEKDGKIYFGFHRSHQLAEIGELNLAGGKYRRLHDISAPSMLNVSSTAYDSKRKVFFYTTNNNRLYRDIWALDLISGTATEIFHNKRIGDLTFSVATDELWGVRHNNGQNSIVVSKYPFKQIRTVTVLNPGVEVSGLSVSPDGKVLSCVLHETDGTQSLILLNAENLKENGRLKFFRVTSAGTPENPSWDKKGENLYWNAYANGVSNIFKYNLDSNKVSILSNVLSGLFKPIPLDGDSLLVFEFSTKGFRPGIIKDKSTRFVPAINYLGQKIFDKNEYLAAWNVENVKVNEGIKEEPGEYSALKNLDILSFIPMVSGFQKQKVLGFYAHISDPLIFHNFKIEAGYSPFNEQKVGPRYHFRLTYDYKQKFSVGLEHNAPDFYDLFNSRKRGMIGSKLRLAYKHYWIYDVPYKLVQKTQMDFYHGVEYINDNLTRVSEPDFMVAQTIINSQYLRRSIGSSDYEKGDIFTFTIRGFASDPNDPQYSAQTILEWEHLMPFLAKHNTFRFKIGAGYHLDNPKLIQSRFYFGGFGNRRLENVNVKQYRKVFRFPGIPIYSLSADRFVKIMFENNFPPIRFSNVSFLQQYLSHIDFSIYTHSLLVRSDWAKRWINVGGQINFLFKHWFNLESTLSFGVAKAWNENGSYFQWFVSYKLLKS